MPSIFKTMGFNETIPIISKVCRITGDSFICTLPGGFFIVTWEIPAPTTQVEKTIPDDRFPR